MRKDYYEQSYPLRIRTVFISVMMTLISLFYLFPKVIESEIKACKERLNAITIKSNFSLNKLFENFLNFKLFGRFIFKLE